MYPSDEVYNSLVQLHGCFTEMLKESHAYSSRKYAKILYSFEKFRMELYEALDSYYSYTYDLSKEEAKINTIIDDYKAVLKDDILQIYIPEKLPTLARRSSYAHKQVLLNVQRVTKPFENLFYDKFVIVIIKIFERRKIWDADNRTVKPILDGLIYGGVIKDDNILNTCYMVQGFYSEVPHIEVSVLEANKILNYINGQLPKIA